MRLRKRKPEKVEATKTVEMLALEYEPSQQDLELAMKWRQSKCLQDKQVAFANEDVYIFLCLEPRGHTTTHTGTTGDLSCRWKNSDTVITRNSSGEEVPCLVDPK